ncbi:hypothetical protein [Burkholderia cenocepacia]|uniref:hypothetical protein n=1 Tax=Burkholderia cenocepacia TaxID=95486 RepID=UPI000F58A329|nr:hypothetical protein [Burkholderia cenocepacia]
MIDEIPHTHNVRAIPSKDRTGKQSGRRGWEATRVARCECPVRAGPGNPDPALRAADLVSAARRIFFCSSLRLLSGSLHFFLTASGHYPLNSAEVKRLRLHPRCYTGNSATVFPNAYGHFDAIAPRLHSLRRSF